MDTSGLASLMGDSYLSQNADVLSVQHRAQKEVIFITYFTIIGVMSSTQCHNDLRQ